MVQASSVYHRQIQIIARPFGPQMAPPELLLSLLYPGSQNNTLNDRRLVLWPFASHLSEY